MNQHSKSINPLREKSFFFSLLAVAAVFPFSEAFVSIFSGLLLLQALVMRSWLHHSFSTARLKIALFPVSVFLIYLVGSFFAKDVQLALYELKKTAFWLVFPLAVALSPKLSDKKIYAVLITFVAAVIAAGIVFLGNLVLLPGASFRSLSMISHIRFSFQVILSLIILSWFYFKSDHLKYNKSIILIAFTGLLVFLFLLKSLLGIVAFLGTLVICLLIMIFRLKNRKWQIGYFAGLIAVVFFPFFLVARVVADYYDFKDVDRESIESTTISGNYYAHNFEEGARENGYLVYLYVCDEELRNEWNKRSNFKYDDLLNGYPLSSTLIRYMTSRGLKKDSVGISQLSDDEILLVESGMTNYKFDGHQLSVYPRIYETVWELDNYFRTGDPNFKSVAQRMEYLIASLYIIRQHPIFGIGTGNWKLEYNEAYDAMKSKLLPENRASSHNQYINYLVKFGITGTGLIIFAILFPVLYLNHRRNYIFILFLIVMAIANFGDANLETHMGLSFFSFFYSLFLMNSTKPMKESPGEKKPA